MNKALILLTSIGLLGSCSSNPTRLDAQTRATDAKKTHSKETTQLVRKGEYHFAALKQVTFDGKSTQAYFNAQGTKLIFQSKRDGFQCDQTFGMDTDGRNIELVSTGLGRTTGGYLFPQSPKLVYSSSHKTKKYCDERSLDWPLLPDLDIYVADDKGKNPTLLSPHSGYDGQAVISPAGDAIIFTSTRNKDVDVWIMTPDGRNAKQLTNEIGYDGGAAFNHDGTKIVYQANHPNEKVALDQYWSLLKNNLVRPEAIDLFVMNRNGLNKTNIVSNGAINLSPHFHPDGKRIIFSSNMDDPSRKNFDLYIVNIDGSVLERITYNQGFDGFPMFSSDGKQLVFSSSRGAKKEGDKNIFVADWSDDKQKQTRLPKESKASWSEKVMKISSEEMGGRGIGTEGLKRAEKYLVNEFNKIGYQVTLQPFLVDVAVAIEKSTLQIKRGATTYTPTKKDMGPFSFSGDGTISGDLVFVAFGGQGKGWDNYKDLDVEGKTVVVVGKGAPRYTAINAKQHGAAAVLILNGPNLEKDEVQPFTLTRGRVGIPVLNMTWSFANKVFGDLKSIHAHAAKKIVRQPHGEFTLELETRIKRSEIKANNIIATLKGKTSKRKKGAIVVGAHYDHLGIDGEESWKNNPYEKVIHPGADDNASGVATVLEIAKFLKSEEDTFKRDIIFVLFSGEESGLLGSQHFVSDPTQLKNVEFMLNFDMIGRMTDSRVHLSGTGTAKGLVDTVRRSQLDLGLDVKMSPDGFGPSDQSSFFAKRVPVLHFFTGLHEDYHRPSDTFEKLNPDGAQTIGTLALRILTELADQTSIQFTKVLPTAKAVQGHSIHAPRSYFGSVPEALAKQPKTGILLGESQPGSPSEKAGLKAGDILVKFGKYDVRTFKDFMAALGKYEAGETVTIVVERSRIQIKLKTTLEEPKKKSHPKNLHK